MRDTYSPSCDAAVGLVGFPHIYGWANIYGLQRIIMCLRYTLNSADPDDTSAQTNLLCAARRHQISLRKQRIAAAPRAFF